MIYMSKVYTLLLADVLEIFKNLCLNTYKLHPT